MAVFHRATLAPTKEEVLASWVPTRPWGAPGPFEVIGSYRFDDPEGRVGMEAFLVRSSDDGSLLHVPLTYRDEPLVYEGGEAGLITTMDHSVLGRRWVYDGVRDPRFVLLLAAVTMTGQGEALGMAVYEGRWHVAPTNVRIHGGGWTLERVPVDGFELVDGDGLLRNERFELEVVRRPSAVPGGAPAPLTLTATWPGEGGGGVVVATVRERGQEGEPGPRGGRAATGSGPAGPGGARSPAG